VELVAWEVQAVRVVWAVLGVLVASAVQEVLAGSAASVVRAVRRNYLPVAVAGSTTHNIAVARRMEIAQQRIGSEVPLAETLLVTVKPAPGKRLAVREAILPAAIAADRASVEAIALEALA
jgi:hypothetical protein